MNTLSSLYVEFVTPPSSPRATPVVPSAPKKHKSKCYPKVIFATPPSSPRATLVAPDAPKKPKY